MQRIRQPRTTERDWGREFATPEHFDEVLHGDAFVEREDGSPLMVVLRKALSREACAKAYGALHDFKELTDQRGVSSGVMMTRTVKEDGTRSNFNRMPRVLQVNSGIAGFYERTTKKPFCHGCGWSDRNPEKFRALLPLSQEVAARFKEHLPERFSAQEAIAQKAPDWLVPGTPFSTITINRNFRTACHKDAGDLPDGFSCITVLRGGAFSGGELVLPAYRLAVAIDTGDLVLFDPHEFHGNTEMRALNEKPWNRISLVFYYRTRVQQCLSPAAELEFAKNYRGGPLRSDDDAKQVGDEEA